MTAGSTLDAEVGWIDDTFSTYIQLIAEREYEQAADVAEELVDSDCGMCVKMGMSLYGGASFLAYYPSEEGEDNRREAVLDSANALYEQVVSPLVEEEDGV